MYRGLYCWDMPYIVIDEYDTVYECESSEDAQAKMEELRQMGHRSLCVKVMGRVE